MLTVLIVLVILVGIIGTIVYRDIKETRQKSYQVKEILPNGSIVTKKVPIKSPSIGIVIETESGKTNGIVPLESNKKFRID